jgi:hypothetical protein
MHLRASNTFDLQRDAAVLAKLWRGYVPYDSPYRDTVDNENESLERRGGASPARITMERLVGPRESTR